MLWPKSKKWGFIDISTFSTQLKYRKVNLHVFGMTPLHARNSGLFSHLSPVRAPQFKLCIVCNDSQPHVSEVSPEHALEDVLNSALQSRQTSESQKAWATAPKMALAAQKSCVQDAPLEYLFPVNDHGQRKLFQGFKWLLFLSTWHQPSNAVAVS